MEPSPGPVPDPELGVQADLAATYDHGQEGAAAGHEQIASAFWVALRQLGVTSGQISRIRTKRPVGDPRRSTRRHGPASRHASSPVRSRPARSGDLQRSGGARL